MITHIVKYYETKPMGMFEQPSSDLILINEQAVDIMSRNHHPKIKIIRFPDQSGRKLLTYATKVYFESNLTAAENRKWELIDSQKKEPNYYSNPYYFTRPEPEKYLIDIYDLYPPPPPPPKPDYYIFRHVNYTYWEPVYLQRQ